MVHLTSALVTALLLATSLLPPSSACVTHLPPKRSDPPSFPYPTYGSDARPDAATTGYSLNHLCLNVRNLTASVRFYSSVLGMRTLFTLHVSEHYSVTYMAHSHGGRNGSGYQTTEELIREKNNSEGLLELINVDVPDNSLPPSTWRTNTFGHIGMVVPDIKATQARIDTFPNVKVLKPYGGNISLDSSIATASGLSPEIVSQLSTEEQELILKTIIPFDQPFIIIADPDGNMIEIQAQDGSAFPE